MLLFTGGNTCGPPTKVISGKVFFFYEQLWDISNHPHALRTYLYYLWRIMHLLTHQQRWIYLWVEWDPMYRHISKARSRAWALQYFGKRDSREAPNPGHVIVKHRGILRTFNWWAWRTMIWSSVDMSHWLKWPLKGSVPFKLHALPRCSNSSPYSPDSNWLRIGNRTSSSSWGPTGPPPPN